MSLSLFISNNLEKLADKLHDRISIDSGDIFSKEYIVVQTDGLSRWIAVQLASKSGIFTNFEFISPNKLIYELFKLASLRNPETFETNNLKWLVFFILEEKEFISLFPDVASYYQNDRIKQLQIATTVSDLFDQYAFYRPDYIKNWNSGEMSLSDTRHQFHEKWQSWIWNKIKDQIGSESEDKVRIRESLLEKLEDGSSLISKVKFRFKRISLFGFSSFTQYHIEIILKLMNGMVDIDFYLFNPSPEVYWLQDVPEKTRVKIERYFRKNSSELNLLIGNELLMNLGKTAKYFYLMLFENEEFINVMDNESLVMPPSRNSLLKLIQHDIYYNVSNEKREKIPDAFIADGSIHIASNYSVIREVEALHNYILDQINNFSYSPKEIIVEVTDIDLYTQYIKAVFDNSAIRIPYSIADRSYHGADNLIGMLKEVLSLRDEEISSEDVIKLLEFEPIKKKYGINKLEKIRTIIEKANIRKGISGNECDETYLVSWKQGIEKILLGFAIKTSDLTNIAGTTRPTIPLDLIEGDYVEQSFKLVKFAEDLIEILKERKNHRSLTGWKDHILNIIEKLLIIEDDNLDLLHNIYDKLTFPDVIVNFGTKLIPYEVFYNAFTDSLYSNKRSGKFITGQLTFCSMVPMRSIPFKVVAMLGLNKNSFPRKTRDISFDLMKAEHRTGDRDTRESDKFLFLEALLSAKDKLYLSYIGQDVKTKTEIPPSPVIDELLDYIENKTVIEAKEILVHKHPLHNHSSRYFDNPALFTYQNFMLKTDTSTYFQTKDTETEFEINSINLNSFLSFYKNPIKWYFNKKLRINYDEAEVLLPDSEIFLLDNLQNYKTKLNLLETSDSEGLKDYIVKEKIAGNLPLKNMSGVVVEILEEEIIEIKKTYDELRKGQNTEKISVSLNIGNDLLEGEIGNIFDDKLILVNFSKDNSKSAVQLKLYCLILSAFDNDVRQFIMISPVKVKDKDEFMIEKIDLKRIDTEKAQNDLELLVKTHKIGFEEIFAFYPSVSYKLYKSVQKSGGDVSDKVIETFFKDLMYKNEKGYDKYLQKIFDLGLDDNMKVQLENNEHSVIDITEVLFSDITVNIDDQT